MYHENVGMCYSLLLNIFCSLYLSTKGLVSQIINIFSEDLKSYVISVTCLNKNTKVLIIYSIIFHSLHAWFFGSKLVLIEKNLTKFEEN